MTFRSQSPKGDDEELQSLTGGMPSPSPSPSHARFHNNEQPQIIRKIAPIVSTFARAFVLLFASMVLIQYMFPSIVCTSALATSATHQQQTITEDCTPEPSSNLWDFQPNERCWDELTFGSSDDNLLYKTTLSQCKGALANMGDEGRLLRLADKLVNGECITAVAFGGSVTCGMDTIPPVVIPRPMIEHKRAPWNAYPAHLENILNVRFPCSNGNHSVTNICHPGTASDHVYMGLESLAYDELLKTADLVLIDTAVNDRSDIHRKKGSFGLESNGQASTKDDQAEVWTEAILRTLRTEYPQTATIWAAVAWRGWQKRNSPPYHVDAEAEHLRVLDYYRTPQVVIRKLFGPGHDPDVMEWLDKEFFIEGNIHPTIAGHKLIASTLMYTIRSVIARRDDIRFGIKTWPRRLDIPKVPLFLPKTWTFGRVHTLDLTHKNNIERYSKTGENCGSGWKYDTDVPGKDKTLMTDVSDSCVVLDLSAALQVGMKGKSINTLILSFLHSYENYGKASVELFENEVCGPETEAKPDCENRKVVQSFEVNCKWESHTSQQSFTQFAITGGIEKIQQREDCDKYVRVCMLSQAPLRIKLFSIGIK